MLKQLLSTSLSVVAILDIYCLPARSKDLTEQVRKAIQLSTLDQPGTMFHLKATIVPTDERDKYSGRSGEIEIWWASPSQWRREVRSPEFHQIEIFNDGKEWQENEGDYFPEWLRETAVALVRPVPPVNEVLEAVKTAEVKKMFGTIHIGWITNTGTAQVHNIERSEVDLDSKSGRLDFAAGLGWNGDFKDYREFHGRLIARQVISSAAAATQVRARIITSEDPREAETAAPNLKWIAVGATATVTTLEDLGPVPEGFFDVEAKGESGSVLHTLLLDETTFRKNLLYIKPVTWPTVEDGALHGNVTTELVVDREGKVIEIFSVVSENNAMREVGMDAVANMRFRPFLENGVPVQVMSQFTLPFETHRH